MQTSENQNRLKYLIIGISILIPVVVAFLYWFAPEKNANSIDVSFLPKVNASINFLVSCFLVFGLVFIKKGNIENHKKCMLTAFILSSLFLISYVTYHFLSESAKFGGEGIIRPIYFFILITHIILAAGVLPFILFSFYFSLTNRIENHKKLSKFTWPIWFYVSVTGVLVYLINAPYY